MPPFVIYEIARDAHKTFTGYMSLYQNADDGAGEDEETIRALFVLGFQIGKCPRLHRISFQQLLEDKVFLRVVIKVGKAAKIIYDLRNKIIINLLGLLKLADLMIQNIE